jgi:hypothetical protein
MPRPTKLQVVVIHNFMEELGKKFLSRQAWVSWRNVSTEP